MGNHLYRPTPRRTHLTQEGRLSYCDFGASQITGWRHKQEDRYICLPKYFKDLSFFGVYDGHGGENVVQYLQKYLHQHILNELMLHNDPELALYLGFLNCDNSLRNITQKEFNMIQEDLNIEFDVPDKEERREVIFGYKDSFSKNSAGASKDSSDSARTGNDHADSAGTSKDSTDAPGTSKGGSNLDQDEFKSEVISTTINMLLPSLKFLTKDPVEEDDDDDSDEDYDPTKDNIKPHYFETSENRDEESAESKVSSGSEDETMHDSSSVMVNEELPVKTNNVEGTEIYEARNIEKNDEFAKDLDTGKNRKEEKNCACESPEHNCGTCEADVFEKKPDSDRKNPHVYQEETATFALTCGSTATVLLLNNKKLYIANVGDSRCVACINGIAVDLTVDHVPTLEEEEARIINAGGKILDERVNGRLDMSRAFGDFELKEKNIEPPFEILSCEPYITTIEVTPDLEFVIIASDGIWNTMDSADVVNYLKNRLQSVSIELRDVCAEMFEEMLPSEVTEDGSGCDNMTAILIQFKDSENNCNARIIGSLESFKYYYPPQHKKKFLLPDNNVEEEDMLPESDNQVSEEQLEDSSFDVCYSVESHQNVTSSAHVSPHCTDGDMQQFQDVKILLSDSLEQLESISHQLNVVKQRVENALNVFNPNLASNSQANGASGSNTDQEPSHGYPNLASGSNTDQEPSYGYPNLASGSNTDQEPSYGYQNLASGSNTDQEPSSAYRVIDYEAQVMGSICPDEGPCNMIKVDYGRTYEDLLPAEVIYLSSDDEKPDELTSKVAQKNEIGPNLVPVQASVSEDPMETVTDVDEVSKGIENHSCETLNAEKQK